MTHAEMAVLIAGLLPYAAIGFAKSAKGYDNAEPRDFEAALTGWRKRADHAHRNHFEAFPFFAAAVLIAEHGGAEQGRLDHLAIAFIAVRVLYTGIYLANLASLRTLVWVIGFGLTITIFRSGI